MSQVKLKRALLVGGIFYKPGVQEIPDEALKHEHFVRYIEAGIVVAPENEELEKFETPVERAQRIAEREKDAQAKNLALLKKVAPAEKAAAAPDDGKAKKSKKG